MNGKLLPLCFFSFHNLFLLFHLENALRAMCGYVCVFVPEPDKMQVENGRWSE